MAPINKIVLIVFILFSAELAFSFDYVAKAESKASMGVADSIDIEHASGEEKVNLLCDLCVFHRREQPQKAVEYGKQALQIAEEIGYPEGEARAMDNIGLGYYFLGDYESALDYFKSSLALRRNLNQKEELANTLSVTGNTYQFLGNYTLALQHYSEALLIREAISDSVGIATTLANMSIIYRTQREYPEAIEAQNKALEIYKKMNNEEGIAYSYYNMAIFYRILEQAQKSLNLLYQSIDLYQKLGDKKGIALNLEEVGKIYATSGEIDKAMNTYFEVLTIRKEIDDKHGIAEVHNTIGKLYFQKGSYQKAAEHYDSALDIHEYVGSKIGIARVLTNIGNLALNEKDYREAESCFMRSLEITKQEKVSELLTQNYYGLARVYASYGSFKDAYKYMNLYLHKIENEFSERNKRALLNLQYLHGVEKKEQEIQMLRQQQKISELELEEQRYLLFTFIGFSILAIILGLVLYMRIRMRTKHNLFLNSVIDSLAHPFYVIDADTNEVILKNKAATNEKGLFGHQECLAALLDCEECDKDEDTCPITQVKTTGQPVTHEHIVDDPENAEKRVYQIQAYPVFNDNGKLTNIIHYSIDITEKKLADEKIKETEEIFRKLTDTAQDAIIITDEDSNISFWNDAAETMTQYHADEVRGKKIWQFISRKNSIQQFESIASDKEFKNLSITDARSECFVQRKDKEMIPVEVSFSSVEIRGSQHSLTIIRDISERKKAEAEISQAKNTAEAANNVKSNFLANMSHELRTPLNGILGYSQILERDKTLSNLQKEGVKIIKSSGEHLLTLINDILDLAKLDSNKLVLIQHDFYLKDFLKSIENIGSIKADQHNIPFHYHEEQPLPEVMYGDERRIRQVLLNIISNAFKFTREGFVELTVSAEYRENETFLIFSVTDTGIGIPENKLQDMFLPFQQGSNVYNKSDGIGAGLAITNKLLRLLEGSLEVKSTPGSGSTFVVTLKSAKSTRKIENGTLFRELIAAHRKHPVNIVLIDSSEQTAKLLDDYFNAYGIEVLYYDSIDTLEKSEYPPFCDVLIINKVLLPEDNVMQKELRKKDRYSQSLVIALSNTAFEEDKAEIIEAGCDELITKPINLDSLYALLERKLSIRLLIKQMRFHTANSAITFPPQEHLRNIYEFAALGDIKSIEETINFLDNDTYYLFVTVIKTLIGRYELESIVSALAPYIEE